MQNIFANTRRVHIIKWHMDLFSQAPFAENILLKFERKCSRNRSKTFLQCLRIIFSQIWQTLWKNLLLDSSSFAKDWQSIVTWGNAILSRRFLGGFVVFLQSWMFCNLVKCLQILFANFKIANFCNEKKNFYRVYSQHWLIFVLQG